MVRKWLHGLAVGLLLGSLFVAFPGAQSYIWSSINGVPYAPALRVGAGTVAAPSVAIGAANSGLYLSGTNEISLAIAGVQKMRWAQSLVASTSTTYIPDLRVGGTGNTALGEETDAVLQLGIDVNGAPAHQTLKAHDGITGTDIAGANLTLAGGRGTGAGAPGQLILQTSTALGSGTTAQTLATRLIIDASGYVTVGTAAGTGANRLYAGSYYVGTTAGADCTSAAAVTTVKGIVTVCSEPVPDPLSQDEINQLRGLLAGSVVR